jgi:enoyl-CoA hydratase/carnithine racemase
MSYQYAIYEKRDHIAYITINRPEGMNALHPPAMLELNEMLDDFEKDQEMAVAIYTGAGDQAFCAGFDLKYHAETGRGFAYGGRGGFGGMYMRFDLWKPVIAAVNGVAFGGGAETAFACDIIIASENAQFGLPEPRAGILGRAMHRLVRQIPLKVAMGMLLTARAIDAQEAYRIGLVNEVVPPARPHPHRRAVGAGHPRVCPSLRARHQGSGHGGP